MNNATKAMFMKRCSSYSTHGSRTGRNLLGWDADVDMQSIDDLDRFIAKAAMKYGKNSDKYRLLRRIKRNHAYLVRSANITKPRVIKRREACVEDISDCLTLLREGLR